MKIHHATLKWAEDRGITLTYENELFFARKDRIEWSWTDPKTAARACAFSALISGDYPSLNMVYDDESSSFVVKGRTPEGEWVDLGSYREPPEISDLADIAELAMGSGVNPEDGFTEEDEDDKATGSVVPTKYKIIYAERGDATNCGDWLASTLKANIPTVAKDGKLVVDVITLDIVFKLNGVMSEEGKWGRAFHDANYRSNGWEGRFSMSGRNVLRKRVADAGYILLAENEKHMAPEEWCAEHRSAPKRTRKKDADTEEVKGA